MKKPHPSEARDQAIIASAVYFTATARQGGTSHREERPTRAEAEAIAAEMAQALQKSILIYAVNAEGRSAYAGAVDFIPQPTETTMTTQTYTARSAAVRAARRDLCNPKAEPGKDFVLTDTGKGFSWSFLPEEAPVAPKPEAKAKKPSAKAEKMATDGKVARAAPDAAPKGKRAAQEAAAAAGELPQAPDFSADTHKRFRPQLAKLVAMVEAGDITGLEAEQIKTISTSPKAMNRYRNLAVIALKARKAGKGQLEKATQKAMAELGL